MRRTVPLQAASVSPPPAPTPRTLAPDAIDHAGRPAAARAQSERYSAQQQGTQKLDVLEKGGGQRLVCAFSCEPGSPAADNLRKSGMESLTVCVAEMLPCPNADTTDPDAEFDVHWYAAVNIQSKATLLDSKWIPYLIK